MSKGLVHIYHGDGKGKTTCAVGLSIRALGAGYTVIFVQFLKGGDTSELHILKDLDHIEIYRCEKDYKFTWLLDEDELRELKADHTKLVEQVIARCKDIEGNVLVVFDELCATYGKDLVDRTLVYNFIKHKPDQMEIVMTGRNPMDELKELADYISELKKERHPMDQGVTARKGIEV